MEIKKNTHFNILNVLLLIFSFTFVVTSILLLYNSNVVEIDSEGLRHIEFIGESIEKVTNLTLENSVDAEFNDLITNAEAALSPSDSGTTYFVNSREINILISKLNYGGVSFQKAVLDFNDNGNVNALLKASEIYNGTVASIIKEVNAYILDLLSFIDILKLILIANIIALVIIILKITVDKIAVFRKNKILTQKMKIDLETGVFNSVKCQELLKAPLVHEPEKEKMILVFELNTLDKNGEAYHGSMKKEVLLTFAQNLKKTTGIFDFEVFIGRYNDNKFMACFTSSDEKDVEVFLDDINYLIDRVNIIEQKPFKLSFFVGYIITTERMRGFTMEELFNAADQNMSINKMAIQGLGGFDFP